jgi:putative ABC transport system permease protein
MTFWQDVRFALRDLRKGFLVTLLAILSLALAIGGNTTVFGLINALIFRPLPYPEPDRIVLIGEREESAQTSIAVSPANFVDWKERNRSFIDLAGFRPVPMSLGAGERPEPIVTARVSPSFFELLGARPFRGRTFATKEGAEHGHRVVILNYAFWQERFDEGEDPIGSTLTLNRESYTVVGVLPEDFEFFNPQVELWLPLPLPLGDLSRDERNTVAVGRLRPGTTMEQATADMKSIHEGLAKEYPAANRGFVVDVTNFQNDIPSRQGRILFGLLQGAVLFVLLIACVNIANLLLARTQGRRREIALKSALGAGRMRIIRQLLTESLVLAVVGGVLGLMLGMFGLRLVANGFADVLPRYWTPVVDVRVLALTLGLAALAGLLFGLSPAWMSSKVKLADVVKESGRGSTGGRRRLLTRALVVDEIALAIVLLAGGSILVESFLSIRHGDPGFEMDNLLAVPLTFPNGDEVDLVALSDRVVEATENLPGIGCSAVTSALPQNIFVSTASYSIDEDPSAPEEAGPRAIVVTTTPQYGESLGVPILQGRYFGDLDRRDSPPVAAVSQSVAERHWPGENAVGKRITLQETSREIVGIVANVRQSIINQGESSQGAIYIPYSQQPVQQSFLLVRCQMDPHTLAGSLRNELTAVDSRLSVGQMQTMHEFVDQFFQGANFFNIILIGFGFLALLLAALGTYGVLAYNVTQRSQEIGVRMAMGASPSRVLRMVTRQGATLGIIGLALGAPGVLLIARILDSVIVSAPPVDPRIVVVVFVVLFLATLAASWVPASRAAGLDPAAVLREE